MPGLPEKRFAPEFLRHFRKHHAAFRLNEYRRALVSAEYLLPVESHQPVPEYYLSSVINDSDSVSVPVIRKTNVRAFCPDSCYEVLKVLALLGVRVVVGESSVRLIVQRNHITA